MSERPPVAGAARRAVAGPRVTLDDRGFAGAYAASVCERLGLRIHARPGSASERHPDLDWAASGAMFLTGMPDAAPVLAPAPLATCMDGVIRALRAVAGEQWRGGDLEGAALLGERAAIAGLQRQGRTAPGGSCRLLATEDGWIAVNLARPDDHALLPAWIASDRHTLDPEVQVAITSNDPWPSLEAHVADRTTAELVERARLMGMPVAPASAPPLGSNDDWLAMPLERDGPSPPVDRSPLVLDLSSLWAGPLCAHLLGLAGARVVKLESVERPDGARRGPSAFFDLLNAGKQSVAVSFASARGRAQLLEMIRRADIVVESARPRALRQLGIDARALVHERDGLSWISITGYGRRAPECGWVAFGDDAAAAAGLAAATGRVAQPSSSAEAPPLFCGDAIADPLTGAHAALAALVSWKRGGSRLLDCSLFGTTLHVQRLDAPVAQARVEREGGCWQARIGERRERVAPPRARIARRRAAALGSDTARVLGELSLDPVREGEGRSAS